MWNQPKYTAGDEFVSGRWTGPFYETWKTVKILGTPYSGVSRVGASRLNEYYYPVLVNGIDMCVIPETNINGNFERKLSFKPGYFYITRGNEGNLHPLLGWWNTDPGPQYTRYTGELSE